MRSFNTHIFVFPASFRSPVQYTTRAPRSYWFVYVASWYQWYCTLIRSTWASGGRLGRLSTSQSLSALRLVFGTSRSTLRFTAPSPLQACTTGGRHISCVCEIAFCLRAYLTAHLPSSDFLIHMHPVFSISDVLFNVLDFVNLQVPNPDPFHGHHESCHYNPTLAALAVTCKAFMEPALNVLWKSQRSLGPLVRTLPEDCWGEEIVGEYHHKPAYEVVSTGSLNGL